MYLKETTQTQWQKLDLYFHSPFATSSPVSRGNSHMGRWGTVMLDQAEVEKESISKPGLRALCRVIVVNLFLK